jgi:putative addiction module component (TIGR02574 family)
LDHFKTQLARLSADERAELAHYLIESLDDEVDPDAEAAWDTELARRLAEIESGETTGEPAARVFVDLRAKYS